MSARTLPLRAMRGEGVGTRARTVKRRAMQQWFGVIGVVLGLGLLHVWSRVAMVGVRYELSEAEQRHAALHKQREQLDGKIGALKAVERLMTIGTTQLRMMPPQPQQIVVVQLPESMP